MLEKYSKKFIKAVHYEAKGTFIEENTEILEKV